MAIYELRYGAAHFARSQIRASSLISIFSKLHAIDFCSAMLHYFYIEKKATPLSPKRRSGGQEK